jgi:hypothetical protein
MIDDTPGIRFDPPLARPEAGDAARRRWGVAARAEELYHAAFEDLTVLLEMGLMTLPEAGTIAEKKVGSSSHQSRTGRHELKTRECER